MIDACYPLQLRFDEPGLLFVDASHVDASTSLVGLSAFKTRIVLSDEEDDLDRYLRSLIAQAVQIITEIAGWPMTRGAHDVTARYGLECVRQSECWLRLPGPVDTSADVALVDAGGGELAALSWDDATVDPVLGAPATMELDYDASRVAISAAQTDYERTPAFRLRYTLSWDPWIPAKSVDHPLAEIVYRIAGTLFTYRESGDMGYKMARQMARAMLPTRGSTYEP